MKPERDKEISSMAAVARIQPVQVGLYMELVYAPSLHQVPLFVKMPFHVYRIHTPMDYNRHERVGGKAKKFALASQSARFSVFSN